MIKKPLTVFIPEDIHDTLKSKAELEHRTITGLVILALENYLKGNDK